MEMQLSQVESTESDEPSLEEYMKSYNVAKRQRKQYVYKNEETRAVVVENFKKIHRKQLHENYDVCEAKMRTLEEKIKYLEKENAKLLSEVQKLNLILESGSEAIKCTLDRRIAAADDRVNKADLALQTSKEICTRYSIQLKNSTVHPKDVDEAVTMLTSNDFNVEEAKPILLRGKDTAYGLKSTKVLRIAAIFSNSTRAHPRSIMGHVSPESRKAIIAECIEVLARMHDEGKTLQRITRNHTKVSILLFIFFF